MKTITISQGTKPHDANRLHDQLIAAGITPLLVESTANETRIMVEDQVTDAAVQSVVAAHVKPNPEVLIDWQARLSNINTAIENANTLPQLKIAVADLFAIVSARIVR